MASPMVAALLVFLFLMVGKAGAGRHCPLVKCRGCSTGYVYSNGCQTCNCKPGPVCEPVRCIKKCLNGYVYVNGCKTCTCLPRQECPVLKCRRNCPYGCIYINGCPTCTCRSGYKCQDTCGVFCEDRRKSALCAQCPCV